MPEERNKPTWHNCQTVEVSKVVLELTGNNSEFVHRVRLETDTEIDITYKPRVAVTEEKEIAGFDTIARKSELLSVSDFVVENPMLKQLSEDCKKKPRKVVLGYATIGRFDETEQKELFYNYMRDTQFKIIYYEKFHKGDKSNIEAQEKAKKKFEEQEL